MTHTRSDHPQPVSPRIPRPTMVPRVLHCSPIIEDRIRTILTWNAGDCGLITDAAVDLLLSFYFANRATVEDFEALASPEICTVLIAAINEIRCGKA